MLPFDEVKVSQMPQFITGARLQSIEERPICLMVRGRPRAWVVSYGWYMQAEALKIAQLPQRVFLHRKKENG